MAIQIYGIQRAQARMLRAIDAVRPAGGLGRAVWVATVAAHRYAMYVTHVDTGALKASHTMQVAGAHGRIYISPTATRSDGRRPADYGPYEHGRGGSHAFYQRTVQERGAEIAREAAMEIRRGLRP